MSVRVEITAEMETAVLGRRSISAQAKARYAEDEALAQRLGGLLEEAREAEERLRDADRGDQAEERVRAQAFDAALTEAMRAAYAARRVEIGPRGYDDRIVRRKRMATPKVAELTELAERLLTLREDHRLHGVARLPRTPAA
jgi:hypothetical protein